MDKILVVMIVTALTFLGGCIAAPVVPPIGIIYTQMGAPLKLTGPHQSSSKRGESSVTAILGMVSTGDGSIAAAARAGGISSVNHVDYKFRNVIGIYQKYTTVVYGD